MKVALIEFLKSAQKYGIEELVNKTNCERCFEYIKVQMFHCYMVIGNVSFTSSVVNEK